MSLKYEPSSEPLHISAKQLLCIRQLMARRSLSRSLSLALSLGQEVTRWRPRLSLFSISLSSLHCSPSSLSLQLVSLPHTRLGQYTLAASATGSFPGSLPPSLFLYLCRSPTLSLSLSLSFSLSRVIHPGSVRNQKRSMLVRRPHSQITFRTKFIAKNSLGVTQPPQNELSKSREGRFSRCVLWGWLAVGGSDTRWLRLSLCPSALFSLFLAPSSFSLTLGWGTTRWLRRQPVTLRV